MYKRQLVNSISEALTDTPVVMLNGARQTGKSTLCRQLLEEGIFEGSMVTFDDPTILNAASLNPMTFLEGLDKHLIIDEVQRVPEILLSIKKLVDQDRKNRKLILTGSANVMTFPKIADSLAGRMEAFNLWPLSQNEIIGQPSQFLTTLTSVDTRFRSFKSDWKEILKNITIGGYPEALTRVTEKRRSKWFESYLQSLLQKDIRELANIDGLTQIPNILQLIATRISSTINFSDISRLSGVKNTTLQRYIALLENIFLILKIPAWTPNAEGQFVKSPKIYLNDTGLLCHLIGEDVNNLLSFRTDAGPLLENYVLLEIIKQLSWSDQILLPYHFSIHKGNEVDLVLANKKSQLFGIEIKSAASLNEADFKGLQKLEELSKTKFQKGIVLYTGDKMIPFGEKMYAVPIGNVWT